MLVVKQLFKFLKACCSIEERGAKLGKGLWAIKQRALKDVNNYLNNNIHSYLDTSGGQSSNLYLNVANLFFYTSVY